MQERHDLLEKSIGYLDMEQEALENGYLISYSSVLFIFVGTLLELMFFHLYNGAFHPFANILKESGPNEGRLVNCNHQKDLKKSIDS